MRIKMQSQQNLISKKDLFLAMSLCIASVLVPNMGHAQISKPQSLSTHAGHTSASDAAMSDHVKEHGGQIYQATTVESKWVRADAGEAALESEWETWAGTDENKLYLKINSHKAESAKQAIDVSALYSRNVSEFWDVQAGMRYHHDANRQVGRSHLDAVLGVYGTTPYLLESKAYVYIGQDQYLGLSLEMDRDFLLTQKWIVQPHVTLEFTLADDSHYAQSTGLSHVEAGLETRYEITPQLMPFADISYRYEGGASQTRWQHAAGSDGDWHYAAGLRFMF